MALRPWSVRGCLTGRRSAFLALLGALLVIEIVLRFILGNYCMSDFLGRSTDREVCTETLPGAEATYTGWLWRVAPSSIHINRNGARGADFPDDLGETLRIVTLGDSFTFGQGVDDGQAFPAVLERTLRSIGIELRVLNFGVPGHSLANSVALLRRKGLRFAPDVVLVTHFASEATPHPSMCADLEEDEQGLALPPRPAPTPSEVARDLPPPERAPFLVRFLFSNDYIFDAVRLAVHAANSFDEFESWRRPNGEPQPPPNRPCRDLAWSRPSWRRRRRRHLLTWRRIRVP
jgi:hypothetical protein